MLDLLAIETLLPFLLVLAVVYGGLETVGMFKNKALKTIIAVVMAFFAISNPYVVETVNSLLPYAAIFFIFFFVLGFAKRSLGGEKKKDNTLIIIIIVLVLLLVASMTRMGELSQYNEFFWLIGVIVIVAILYGAYKTGRQ